MLRITSGAIALALLSLALVTGGCKTAPDKDDAGLVANASVEDLAKAIGKEVAQASSRPRMAAASGSPNANTVEFQNQTCSFADTVTWVADGGTFSDGGPRMNVSSPLATGFGQSFFWLDCGGNPTASGMYVDWPGNGSLAAQQFAGPFTFPCDTPPLPFNPSGFYQNNTDAGFVTIYRCYP
jgi:hypothetical protein